MGGRAANKRACWQWVEGRGWKTWIGERGPDDVGRNGGDGWMEHSVFRAILISGRVQETAQSNECILKEWGQRLVKPFEQVDPKTAADTKKKNDKNDKNGDGQIYITLNDHRHARSSVVCIGIALLFWTIRAPWPDADLNFDRRSESGEEKWSLHEPLSLTRHDSSPQDCTTWATCLNGALWATVPSRGRNVAPLPHTSSSRCPGAKGWAFPQTGSCSFGDRQQDLILFGLALHTYTQTQTFSHAG